MADYQSIEDDLALFDDHDDESYSYSYYNDTHYFTYTKLETHVVVILTSIFAVCVAVSCIGNCVVMSVMTCGKKRKQPLNSLMLNLALSDWSLGLLCLPFLFAYTMMSEWIFGEVMCTIIPFAQKTSQIVSIYTVVVIGVDRCRVVLSPLGRRISKDQKLVIVVVIWAVAMGMASPKIVYNSYVEYQTGENATTAKCNEDWPGNESREIYVWLTFALTYLIPLAILCGCYCMVASKLWARTLPGQVDERRDKEQRMANRKAVRTIVALVILFGVCWLPLNIYNVFVVTYNPEYLRTHAEATITARACIFIWLIFSDSVFNPIVYVFLSDKFKKDAGRLMYRMKQAIGIQVTSPYYETTTASNTTNTTVNIGPGSRSTKNHNYIPMQAV